MSVMPGGGGGGGGTRHPSGIASGGPLTWIGPSSSTMRIPKSPTKNGRLDAAPASSTPGTAADAIGEQFHETCDIGVGAIAGTRQLEPQRAAWLLS